MSKDLCKTLTTAVRKTRRDGYLRGLAHSGTQSLLAFEEGSCLMRVWNKRDPNRPPSAIYVGRPSKWGNPFVIGRDGTRKEVIEKYKQYIIHERSDLYFAAKRDLRGKDLLCWCAPEDCHGDVLLEIANS